MFILRTLVQSANWMDTSNTPEFSGPHKTPRKKYIQSTHIVLDGVITICYANHCMQYLFMKLELFSFFLKHSLLRIHFTPYERLLKRQYIFGSTLSQ